MKGLLIKDLRITLTNKKLLLIMLLLAVVLTLTQAEEGASFTISYVTTICGVLVLNTISVDEFDRSITFLMTMPIKKDLYAIEKYVFALSGSLFGCMISSAFCFLFMRRPADEIFVQAVLIFVILSLFQMIILPIQLKFGGEIGRMVLIGIVAVFVLFVNIMKKITEDGLTYQIEEVVNFGIQWIGSLNRWVIYAAGFAIWIGCLLVSVSISRNIIMKKEF